MREEVTWTDLTPCDIASHLYQEFDTQIAPQIVRRILGDLIPRVSENISYAAVERL